MIAIKICLFVAYAFAFSFLTAYINVYYMIERNNSTQSHSVNYPWLWISNVNIRLDTTVNQNSMIRVMERFYIGQESINQFNRLHQTKTCDAMILFYPYFITFPSNSTCFEKNVTLYNNNVWE